jgi:hypothetical protein
MLFGEIILVYIDNDMKTMNKKYRVAVKAGGTYSYHWTLKGKMSCTPIWSTHKFQMHL